MITTAELGTALRRLRVRRSLLQRDVEKILEIPRGTLSQYERGSRTPTLARFTALLDALGADFGDLQRAIDHEAEEAMPPDDRQATDPKAEEPTPPDEPAPGDSGLSPDLLGRELYRAVVTMMRKVFDREVRKTLDRDPEAVLRAMKEAVHIDDPSGDD